jgi:hypothetical protein
MAETAAHLVDHIFPPRPVRQWVLSVPKRLRGYLEREPQAVSAVLHSLLRVIEVPLCQASGASSHARFGAVSFIHRFGSSRNRHVHYHCCVIDGAFEPAPDDGDAVPFRPANRPPGRMLPSRWRTGTSSASCSPTLSLISALPGNCRLSAAGDG